MDRPLVYYGQVPRALDLASGPQLAMVGIGKLAESVLGTPVAVSGFTLAQTTIPSLSANLGAGVIYQTENLEASAVGPLTTDTHTIVKQGILLDPVTLTFTPPGTVGYSQNFLVQVQYQDVDTGSVVLPYANPTPGGPVYNGPGNAGTANNTIRKGAAVAQVKAGTAASTGTQTTPTPDAGWSGLFVVTLAYGGTTVTAPNIATYSGAPFIPATLPLVPASVQKSSWIYAGVAGGTSTALTASITPAVSSLTTGMGVIVMTGAAANSGAMTLNLNGLGVKSIVTQFGGAINTGYIFPSTLIYLVYNGTAWQVIAPSIVAPVLTGAVTYYVNGSLGNDSNGGTSSGAGAFATIQRAINVVAGLNLNGQTVTINVADGTYAPITLYPANGSGSVLLVGNTSTPGNCIIANAATGSAVTCVNGNQYSLNGFKVTAAAANSTTGDPGMGVFVQNSGSSVVLLNMNYGTCQGGYVQSAANASVLIGGANTISGSIAGNAYSNAPAFWASQGG